MRDVIVSLYFILMLSCTNQHTYMHTCIHAYIHRYIHMDVSVAEWLAWLTSNCGRIDAIGSSPSNGLRPNM